jgi:hypothetical protein
MGQRKSIAKRVRFHCAWIAGVFVVLDALASVWPLFEGTLPIPPLVYAGLGLGFAVASGVGHLIYRDL